MSVIATGNYTIIDYNDAPLLNGWINAQGSKTQGYVPDSHQYIPDYTVTPLRLTACLFSAGTSVDLLDNPEGIITNMQWEVTNSKGITNDIDSANSRYYSVNVNLTDDTSKVYSFKCDYTQPSSRLTIPVKISIDINKVVNGTGIADAVILAPQGNVFKNSNSVSLNAECQLWYGSAIVTTLTSNSFKWWKMDSTGNGGSHGVGEGWREITNGTNGYVIEFRDNTSIITIPRDDVFSSAVYMCTVEYSGGVYKETIVFLDTTDPILVTIDSTGGSIFKNGIGSTVLTAMLFQNGTQIDSDGTRYSYKWYKYDRNGNLVDKNDSITNGDKPYATGKTLEVTEDDVFEKATFRVDIS